MAFSIHREGYFSIGVVFLGLLALNIVVSLLGLPSYVLLLISFFSLFFLGFVVQFFRNPMRKLPEGAEAFFVAPADGKIVVIEEVFEGEYLQKKCWQISIFMSPFDVHANRNVISGEVYYVKHHHGKYLVAWHPKASSENERNTVVVGNERDVVLVRQIAGAVARRICCYVEAGMQVTQGEEYGFIKFGSRTDIFIPLESKVLVSLGMQVYAGQSILAIRPQKKEN